MQAGITPAIQVHKTAIRLFFKDPLTSLGIGDILRIDGEGATAFSVTEIPGNAATHSV